MGVGAGSRCGRRRIVFRVVFRACMVLLILKRANKYVNFYYKWLYESRGTKTPGPGGPVPMAWAPVYETKHFGRFKVVNFLQHQVHLPVRTGRKHHCRRRSLKRKSVKCH